MASAMFPAVIVCFFVFMCPESPRWYIQKGRHGKAWKAIQTLRFNKVQAARDLFYIQFLVKAEKETETGHKYREMISVPRNRRALQASEIVMFMQQFCGINVIGASRQPFYFILILTNLTQHTTLRKSSWTPISPSFPRLVHPWVSVLSTSSSPSRRSSPSTPLVAATFCFQPSHSCPSAYSSPASVS